MYIYIYVYTYIYIYIHTVEQTPVKQMAERLNKTMVKQNVAFVCCDRALFPCVTSVCCFRVMFMYTIVPTTQMCAGPP